MPQIKMTAAVLKNTHSAAKLFLQFYNILNYFSQYHISKFPSPVRHVHKSAHA